MTFWLLGPENVAQRDEPWSTCYIKLHKWLILIFWKIAEAGNSQIRTFVVPKILTRNDVISYFRSATNSVNVTVDFLGRKLQQLATSKFTTTWPTIVFTFRPEMRHNLLPVDSKSYKRVNFGSCSGRDFSTTAQPISKRFTFKK